MTVAIAENHPDLSEVMERLIDAEPDMRCVGRTASAEEVLSKVRESGADALVLDLTLREGSSGLQLIDRLISELPDLRIVVYSGLERTEEAARECRRRGAADFVSKGADFNVLLGALRKTA
jgi:DNA-binding NarL/FixJ family response regulator